MNKFLGSSAVLAIMILAPHTAQAADAALAAAPYDWTGFYIGGQLGADFLHPNPVGGGNPTDRMPDGVGFEAGLNAQALWQTGSFVLGGIIDGNISGFNLSIDCPNPAFTCKDGSNWNASVRAKAGFAADRFLVYGTGGWGWADYNVSATNKGSGAFFSTSTTKGGWVVGAGASYAVNDKWSVNAEYLHYDLGSATPTALTFSGTFFEKPTIDTVVLGVSYKF